MSHGCGEGVGTEETASYSGLIKSNFQMVHPSLFWMDKGYDEDSDDGEGGGPGSVGHHTRKYLRCFAFCFLVLFFLLMLYLPAYNQVQVREAPIFGWSLNTTRDLRVYVQPDNETAIIPAPNICTLPITQHPGKAEKDGDEDGLLLLVIVCSAVSNFEARQSIRETWALEAALPTARVAFLLGHPPPPQDDDEEGGYEHSVAALQSRVAEESRLHGDIIQEGFVDTYNNLTLKSVMLLKWTAQHCPVAHYIMKTDDDMFVNVGAIVAHLRERVRQRRKWQRRRRLGGTEGGQARGQSRAIRVMPFDAEDTLLEGTLICGARPISSTRSKWYAPRYMYSGRVYPDYLSGTGYIMSRSVARRLLSSALSTPLFHLEDVFVTGMCARASGLHPRDHPAFSYQRRRIDDPCGYRNSFTAHRLDASELRLVWSRIKSPTLRCPVTSPPPSSPSTGRPGAPRRRSGSCG
ncbi:beta-1,3-galactosyltransferase 1-like isoform X2 [Ischnura elegans]|uniref:beta-1,3-galactosyltransferase 1-like isoform X2 n=1 Tax=Ischnura elegans TaxID=197161 RepID=UPI001ED8A90F|nr:beta-1,3-galactosyltransferase 1-like isoform X2 [Ischnura elegans]